MSARPRVLDPQNGRWLATSGQVLDMAAAMALKTSGVPLKLGLSSASMSPVEDSICGIVHAGSRNQPHIVLACC
jgi:hypothetical protein